MHEPKRTLESRRAESSSGSSFSRTVAAAVEEPLLPAKISPEAAVEKILALLDSGAYLPARDLARQAAQRFPDHAEARRIADALDPRGKAVVRSGEPRQPDRREEFDWLKNPPAWARGKWVALAGREVLAADESLAEVDRILRATKLDKRPLVHRVD